VVEALEGEIAPIECISADADGQLVCSREVSLDRICPTKVLWTRVQGSIVRTLQDISLNELVEPRKKATV
jgi:Rrf2 family transcriptional regulator, cysteine metabolism repressor